MTADGFHIANRLAAIVGANPHHFARAMKNRDRSAVRRGANHALNHDRTAT
jgi:hypothetical protein